MKNIIKTLLLVMTLALVLLAFAGCEQQACQHTGGEATCTEKAICELCGEAYGPAPAHKTGFVPGLDATCTEGGYTASSYCIECGEVFVPVTDIAATGHKMVDVEGLEATCSKPGYTAYKECEVCGEIEGKEEIPTLAHTMKDVEGLDATCTEDGHTAYKVCEVCGAVEGKEVIKAGHNVGEDGVCTGCGCTPVETAEQLIAAIGAGQNVVLMNNIEMDATLKCPYGNPVGVAQRGGVLDGNGYTLTVNGSGNYYAIITYGGTIKNLTINSGFRAIVLYTPTEDVIIDNVTIYGDDIVYGLNTAEYPTLEGIDIVVKNSSICGWISFAGDYASVSFENCKFTQGVAYDNVIGRLVRPYLSTTFTGCEFVKNAYLDLSALNAGETVTLVGCTVDGVEVTVDVFTTEEDSAEIPFTYEAPAGVELVLTTVEGGVSFHRHGHVVTETVASSCTVAGKEVYTCACGDSYESELALGEHDYDHVVTAPTCTAAGYTTHTCVFCDDSYTDSETEALGHADANGDYKCDKCSTKMLPADGTTLTIPQALAIAKLHSSNQYTTQKYYITGIVTGLYNTQYGNFYIKDDEGNEICIYGLYSADGSTRYDAMSYKPVNGDEVTVYTVLGAYNTTYQGKNAWLDDVVAHEHDYKSTVTEPGCLTEGYTTDTCSICGNSNVHSTVDALGHTTEEGECERCGLTIGGDAPVVGTLAEFTFGANGTASHADPSSKFSNGKSYTVNGYTLKFTSATNCYDGGRDAKGNSCMKMGTSSAVGSFTVTVPDNVTEVVIYVAQYKANTTKISVNGGAAQTITTASNNGAYTAITIDTSVNKTFTFATVSGGVRCMIDTIVFNGTAN